MSTSTLIEKLDAYAAPDDNANAIVVPSALWNEATAALRQHEADHIGDDDEMVERILTVTPEGVVFWRHKDGSHRCLTADDARIINRAMQEAK